MIDELKPLNNLVIIKPIFYDYYKGTQIMTTFSVASKKYEEFNPANHECFQGIVVKTPDIITSGITPDHPIITTSAGSHYIPYKTSLEVEVGDVVWLEYFMTAQLLGNMEGTDKDYTFKENGELYMFYPYMNILARQRDGILRGVNNNYLVEPLKSKLKSESIETTEEYIDFTGIVRGCCSEPDLELEIGDKVHIKRTKYCYLEPTEHMTLPMELLVVKPDFILLKEQI
jgi:hypothetical protein